VPSVEAAMAISDRLAVEHVELHMEDAMTVGMRLKHYGGLFVGAGAAEVLGDYGAGPNHTLPTGGTARSTGGLCVMTFLRVRTWMRVDSTISARQMVSDAVALGEMEGLHGHAAAARARLPDAGSAAAHDTVCVPAGISTRGNIDARLLFAIPKKGRMHEKCLRFLEAAGLEYERPDRVDVAICTNMPIKIVFLPASDIATFVGEGNVDLGITGEDIVAESEKLVNVNLKLGFGKCKLALQVPEEHKNAPLSAYVGCRIVTSFPNITAKFFKPLDDAASAASGTKVQTSIRVVGGSVEAACGLGLADAVVDLVETGTTMKAAGLTMFETLMQTEAVLISNPHSKHPDLTKRLIERIQGYIDSTKYQLINYNVSRESLPAAMKVTPGKKSPSILPLERGDWVAVHAMVLRKAVPEIIDQLIAIGATDVLVFSLANCRV